MPIDPSLLSKMAGTLRSGQYSWLLGAGASKDSKNKSGGELLMPEDLRLDIIRKKGLKLSSSLARAYKQLTPGEVDTYITDRYESSIPGSSLQMLSTFYWRRIFTLNIDDAVDTVYKTPTSVQLGDSITFKSDYITNFDANKLQIIHLHGWVRKPEDGYVFSLPEYASTMGPGGSWIHVLSQTLSTDPFIVAGTLLEEPDIEYFLSNRSQTTARTDRGPSFLIEPDPDAGTLKDCERFGLSLFKGTLAEFLIEIDRAFPDRPLPLGASRPLKPENFTVPVTKRELALLAADVTFQVSQQVTEDADFSFFFGREATDTDIALERDVSRQSTVLIKDILRQRFRSKSWSPHVLLLEDVSGSGKSTILARVTYDLAAEGVSIFTWNPLRSPDLPVLAKLLTAFNKSFVLIIDNFADHVGVVSELFKQIHRDDFLIVASERSYRTDYVIQVLRGLDFERIRLLEFTESEAVELIEKMDRFGLTSTSASLARTVRQHAKSLLDDSIAIAVCRVVNNYRAVERIIESVVRDAGEAKLFNYIMAALASYCVRPGVAYSILSAAGRPSVLPSQFALRDVLPLMYFDSHTRDYVVPANPVLGQRILEHVSADDPEFVAEVYTAIGMHLAPYVNRRAVKLRSPEARLAGRLFDYDDVVLKFLGQRAERFFLDMRRFWSWNSRYWEQFALLKVAQFKKAELNNRDELIAQALSHARHAVGIELHQLPLTTLGYVLIEEMKYDETRRERAFDEAFEHLNKAINLEGMASRIAVHPYSVLLAR